MGGEIKKNLLSLFVGYLRHLFLSQSVFIGFFFVFLPIIYLSNKFTGLAKTVGKILEIYGNIFSINSADEFFKITIGFVCIVLPLVSHLILKIFKATSHKHTPALKIKMLAAFNLVLVTINTLVIWSLDDNFSIMVFFVLLFISFVSIGAYLMSLVCVYMNNKIQTPESIASTVKI